MTFDEMMHWVAQGVMNIDEGETTIGRDSKVHKAMKRLCELVHNERVGVLPLTVEDWRKGLKLALREKP